LNRKALADLALNHPLTFTVCISPRQIFLHVLHKTNYFQQA
jgi:ribosomal protein L20